MRTRARFPEIDAGAGHYESFYVKATRPGGGQGLWLRHTVHKRPGAAPTASLWLTLFDAESAGPRATKASFAADRLSAPEGAYIRVGDAVLEPGHARGSLEGPDLSASWDLSFADDGPAIHHLPYPWLYRTRLPRTKLLSPHPGVRFEGEVTLGDERIAIHSWPGMIGHNWGAEHAERWIWIHGPELDGRPGSYLDLALGRIKVGPLTTPWVGNGFLRLDGSEHRLGGLDRIRSTTVAERPTSCAFSIRGAEAAVRGTVSSEPRNFVAWLYADPAGPEHQTLNCSIADLELEVDRGGGRPDWIQVAGAAAYEIGMRETDHGVPLQPYPDG